MEGSPAATAEEEEVTEKTAIFYLYHPCYFLEEVLRAFFRCLGFEARDSERLKTPSDAPQVVADSSSEASGTEDYMSPQNSASNDQQVSQEQPVDPPSTMATQQIVAVTNRRSRRSGLSKGSGPHTN